jgi:hypothetical protein
MFSCLISVVILVSLQFNSIHRNVLCIAVSYCSRYVELPDVARLLCIWRGGFEGRFRDCLLEKRKTRK